MSRSSLSFLALSSLLAGCSAAVGSQERVDADASKVAALIVVERSTGPLEASHAASVARFVRVQGPFDRSAQSFLGRSVNPRVGECLPVDQEGLPSSITAFELLDVGAITLSTVGSPPKPALVPRKVPEVSDLVSGVFYASREAPAFGTAVGLRTGGSAELPALQATAEAPPLVEGLRVAGAGASDPLIVLSSEEQNVSLTWVSGEDQVFADVLLDEPARSPLRCAFADVGYAAIPLSAFGSRAGVSGTLSFHRIRETPLRLAGVDDAVLRFDAARVVRYVRR